MRGVTKKERLVSVFVNENPFLVFRLANHVFERLRNRLGWTNKHALSQFPGKSVSLSLSEGIVEIAKGGAWKIHLFGWGKFVIVSDQYSPEEWVAVTFYPEKS